jgi:hypothetical protein
MLGFRICVVEPSVAKTTVIFQVPSPVRCAFLGQKIHLENANSEMSVQYGIQTSGRSDATINNVLCRICASHSGGYEEFSPLRYNAL